MNTVNSTSDDRTVNNVVRHVYRVLTDEEKNHMLTIKDNGEWLIKYIDKVGMGREFSIAKTKLEEAVMWAVKGITK